MGSPAETAMNLLHRAEEALKRRARRVIPAEEATLRTMIDSPTAAIALSEQQRRDLEALERRPVNA